MGPIDLLQRLASARVCSWSLNVNDNRASYETPRKWLEDMRERCGDRSITDELLAEVDTTGELFNLQVYANTPVGSYSWYAGSLELLLGRLAECSTFMSLLDGVHYRPPESAPPVRSFGTFAVRQVTGRPLDVDESRRDELVGMLSDAVKGVLDRAAEEGIIERVDLSPPGEDKDGR